MLPLVCNLSSFPVINAVPFLRAVPNKETPRYIGYIKWQGHLYSVEMSLLSGNDNAQIRGSECMKKYSRLWDVGVL